MPRYSSREGLREGAIPPSLHRLARAARVERYYAKHGCLPPLAGAAPTFVEELEAKAAFYWRLQETVFTTAVNSGKTANAGTYTNTTGLVSVTGPLASGSKGVEFTGATNKNYVKTAITGSEAEVAFPFTMGCFFKTTSTGKMLSQVEALEGNESPILYVATTGQVWGDIY